jgi:SAM-dependent methyltransferase
MDGSKLNTNKAIYIHDPAKHNFSAARQILPYIFNIKKIDSVLDIGCGTGTWLSVARELGVKEITGVDGVNLSQEELKIPFNDFINIDLSLPINLNKKFDLLICLEVAEHLSENSAGILIDTLTNHSDFILFSAAIPGQDGQNHLNEQWPGYWQKLFEAKKYYPCVDIREKFWNNEQVEWWYRQNILLYAPKKAFQLLSLSLAESVNTIIHPALFNEKLDKINELNAFINKEVWNPTFKRSLRNLIKSLVKFK